MNDPDIQGVDSNVVPDLEPISIPDQDINPSLQDRINRIEDVLHI